MSDHGQTTEVTYEGVVTYPNDEATTDGGAFDGNEMFSVACPDGGFLLQCFDMFRVRASDSFFRCCRERCYHCFQSCGCCPITCKTVSHSGTARTSSTGAALVGVPRGPVKLVGVLNFYTAGEPVVVYTEVCNHEVPLVMSPVIQATGWNSAHKKKGST